MAVWQIAFETSARRASVALLREDMLVLQVLLDGQTRTAQSIAPAVQSLLDQLHAEQAKLGLVSVAIGPGSFTGLRIGVTAAKVLAFARNCPVVSCDTLEVVISQVRRHLFSSAHEVTEALTACDSAEIDVAINAYRGQVFHRRESLAPQIPARSQPVESRASDTADWSDQLVRDASRGSRIFVSGDVWQNQAALRLDPSANIVLTPAECWHPQAESVGRLAWQKFQQARSEESSEDCFALKPKYLRESAAVEKRAEKRVGRQ